MVEADVDAVPGFAGSPVTGWGIPERIFSGKTERKESGSAEIDAACIDVSFSHLDLGSSVTDS